jgi:hypothetical protein
MQVEFIAHQSLDLTVAEQGVPLSHYLRQPQRLMNALVDPSQIEYLGERQFRLKMRPLTFLHITLQPMVLMEVWSEADGTLCLQSLGCEIRGVDYIDRRFNLDLVGKLVPRSSGGCTQLQGRADLSVQVDLPPALWFTPRPILEAAGNSLLRSVLMTVNQRLTHQLIADYNHWAKDHKDQLNPSIDGRSSPLQEPT